MKKSRYSIITLVAGLLMTAGVLSQNAMAQVPAGVVVDSIGGAYSWRNETPFRSHHVVASNAGKMVFITGNDVASDNALNPIWYYSTDYGLTWSSNSAPFAQNTVAGAVAVAADSNFIVYVAFNRGDSLYFNKDLIGDGTGLLSDILVNTAGTMAPMP